MTLRDLNIKCPILRGNRFNQYLARLEFVAKTEKALNAWQSDRRALQK